MTIKGSKLALLLLLVVALEILLFEGSDAKRWPFPFKPRRRSTSSRPRPSPSRVNNGRPDFNKICATGSSISRWWSQYKKLWEDRIYYFECQKGPFGYKNRHCLAPQTANDYNKPFDFKCSSDGFIAGVESTYSASRRDRRFSFRCCRKNNCHTYDCRKTQNLNTWYGLLDYKVPPGFHLVGVSSEYSKHDRKWKFQFCAFSKGCHYG